MSQYLIEEMAAAKNAGLRFETEVVGGGGDGRLQHLILRGTETGFEETISAAGVFLMIGADPHTGWLPGAIRRDRGGCVLTGDDVPVDRRRGERRPGLLETSLPGVFAVDDLRHGAVLRVDRDGIVAGLLEDCHKLATVCDRKFAALRWAMGAASLGLLLSLLWLLLY